ncbi:MAG: hypothetical protein J5I93_16005 [Pirellulaceae bacterium]|nr:hypothetical protein [Pirellulaceae bacterium]
MLAFTAAALVAALGGCTQQPADRSSAAAPADSTEGASSGSDSAPPAVAGADSPDTALDLNPPASAEPSSEPAAAETPAGTAAGTPLAAPASVPDPDKLFDGWPQPKLVLLVTGRQYGYIEPCGCTGLANQKGGLARRRTLQKQLQEKGWTVVPLDVGNQVRRFGRQAEIKFQMTSEAFGTMQYQAAALGPDDLKLSSGELIAVTASDGDRQSPFLSANVAIIDRSLTPAFKIVEAGGLKIGITAVLGDQHLAEIQSDEIIHQPAAEGLAEVWPQLEEARCDLYVLLAHASLEQSRELARQFKKFDLIVTAGGAGEPTYQPEAIDGSQAVMIQSGTKSMHAGVVGVFDDPEQRLRYQRVPLDARFEDSREMLQLLAAYQQQLQTEGFERLGLRPIPHPSGGRFVGSEACAGCHEEAYDIWKESPHTHATQSLVEPGERTEIQRHFDPECLSCHVTGWNPQKFFPYESGYLSLEKSPKLLGSGCENCHGPGDRHVAAESGDVEVEEDELLALRKSMRLPLGRARQKCLECHDLDNSPDFHLEGAFQKYWQRIKH